LRAGHGHRGSGRGHARLRREAQAGLQGAMSANVYQPAFDETEGGTSRARLGRQAGAGALGLGLYELAPDTSYWPSHYHWANEEMLIVLSGTPSLRTAEGARRLAPGDVVSFRRGPEGTHQLANYDDGVARFL